MDGDAQRTALRALIARDGVSLATLSRALGRNAAWVQQFLARGTPRVLPEGDRATLARFFGVDEAALGGAPSPIVTVPWLDIAVSAGPGRFATGERVVAEAGYAAADLERLGVAAADAGIFPVAGDSMYPTLQDGDRILVDRGRRQPGPAGAIWVIRVGDALFVKRLARAGLHWRIISDNAAEEQRPAAEVTVLGRVVQLVRTL
ncbi:Peptidase S24-like [Sphingomonas guangdongensis]|uniref:Peptidase S24-like n=1 Tax=Sphingomonas guangdongensis TaxID=1141890 RepID=A0A285QX87_9SPHN|nr:S24 family peptidase [Sphingomonas guangdongensis]SOB86533.1 Peptidase S24-like [Sphingomonas guangdongensis]